MVDRITCCMPGCQRTRENSPRFFEWICQKHWSRVPKDMRRAYASAKRRRKAESAINRIWQRCRAAAVAESLMGF